MPAPDTVRRHRPRRPIQHARRRTPKGNERSTNILALPTQQDPPFPHVGGVALARDQDVSASGETPHHPPPPPLLDSAGRAPHAIIALSRAPHTRPATLRVSVTDTEQRIVKRASEWPGPASPCGSPSRWHILPSPRASANKVLRVSGAAETPQATLRAHLKAQSSPVPPSRRHVSPLCAVLAVSTSLDENRKSGFPCGLGGYSYSATGATMAGDTELPSLRISTACGRCWCCF